MTNLHDLMKAALTLDMEIVDAIEDGDYERAQRLSEELHKIEMAMGELNHG